MNTDAPRPDLVEARARVLSDWRQDNGARLLRGDEAFLRKRANVLIAEDLR